MPGALRARERRGRRFPRDQRPTPGPAPAARPAPRVPRAPRQLPSPAAQRGACPRRGRGLPAASPPRGAGPGEPGLMRRNGARGSASRHLRAIERPGAPARAAPEPPPEVPPQPRWPLAGAWGCGLRASEPRGVHGEWGRPACAPRGARPPVTGPAPPSWARPCACALHSPAPAIWSLRGAAATRLLRPDTLCVCESVIF